jgi:hypothetical protein
MAKANAANWEPTRIDASTIDVRLPADDILDKKRRPDGKRPIKLPMRKIVAKLRQFCPGEQKAWDYSYVELDEEGKYITIRMTK